MKIYQYCTMPIFMGIFSGLLILFFVLIANYGLMTTNSSERMPSVTDKAIHIPANL